ncbi:hypothetical protein Ancab_024957 [Ancistrocladus abbreviatus]
MLEHQLMLASLHQLVSSTHRGTLGLILHRIPSSRSVFSPKVLNLTEDDIAAKFAAGVSMDPSKFVAAMVSGTAINAGAIPAAIVEEEEKKEEPEE